MKTIDIPFNIDLLVLTKDWTDLIKPVTSLDETCQDDKPSSDKQTVVYKAVNNDTGDFYIGATQERDVRFKQHLRLLNKNTHPNQKLQDAYNRNPNFTFEVLPVEDKQQALVLENALIQENKADPKCLNIAGIVDRKPVTDETKEKISKGLTKFYQNGGVGSGTDAVWSEESRRKLSESLKRHHADMVTVGVSGRLRSEETKEKLSIKAKERWSDPEYKNKMEKFYNSDSWRARMSEVHSGKSISEEMKRQISQRFKGVKQSPELIEKRRLALLGRKRSEEEIEKCRQGMLAVIVTLTEDQKEQRLATLRERSQAGAKKCSKVVKVYGVLYESVSEAMRQLKMHPTPFYKKLNDPTDTDFVYVEQP